MFKFTVITMTPGDRMARIAFGQNKGRFFFRIDSWKYGLRITGKPKPEDRTLKCEYSTTLGDDNKSWNLPPEYERALLQEMEDEMQRQILADMNKEKNDATKLQ